MGERDLSAGNCPRPGCGDGRVEGRHVDTVGYYTVICSLCHGTGNYPPTGPGWALGRWWRAQLAKLSDALDRIGALP